MAKVGIQTARPQMSTMQTIWLLQNANRWATLTQPGHFKNPSVCEIEWIFMMTIRAPLAEVESWQSPDELSIQVYRIKMRKCESSPHCVTFLLTGWEMSAVTVVHRFQRFRKERGCRLLMEGSEEPGYSLCPPHTSTPLSRKLKWKFRPWTESRVPLTGAVWFIAGWLYHRAATWTAELIQGSDS